MLCCLVRSLKSNNCLLNQSLIEKFRLFTMASIRPQACSHASSPPNDQTKACDIEKQNETSSPDEPSKKQSMFSSLGLLDRFLAVWIFLAMAIGIILGNFVPSTGPALQRGKFVGVSVPIGTCNQLATLLQSLLTECFSCGSSRHDVPYPMQDSVRIPASCFPSEGYLDPDGLQYSSELDYCSFSYGLSCNTFVTRTLSLTWIH